tara:strand:- start:1414 stop:2454 length:1041 start_codon:yes stop_codon:yes gene_type:complete
LTKVAIINDTHFGVRNDSSTFLDYFLSFFENQFFPYITNANIDMVLHLGDFLDRRKYVNFNTLNKVRSRFIEPMSDMGIEFNMIIGNHDTYYRNTNEINSAKELFSNYKHFNVYEKPTTIELDNFCLGMIPWICPENKDEVYSYLTSCNCPIICGHFELTGYEVMRGISFKGGMDDSVLKRFEKVLSGHFHNKSVQSNVEYLGSQYQMTFADLDEKKGFHILDTNTREIEFIENTDKMFYSINTEDIPDDYDYSVLKDKYVKVIVPTGSVKSNNSKILSIVEESSPQDLNIIEEFFVSDDSTEVVDLRKDTITIINEEIDDLTDNVDKDFLKKTIKDIYLEILNDE